MDWWRACTKSRTRLPNIYHIPMHKWQSLKLMWLLFVQIQIFEGDETTRRRSKRNGDDAAWPKWIWCVHALKWRMLKNIHNGTHIWNYTAESAQSPHHIHISAVMPCSNWIWIECVLVGSWRWDHIHTHTQTNAPFFGRSYDIFTASLLLKWRTIFLSLSIHILASIVSVCLFHSGGAWLCFDFLISSVYQNPLCFTLFVLIHHSTSNQCALIVSYAHRAQTHSFNTHRPTQTSKVAHIRMHNASNNKWWQLLA